LNYLFFIFYFLEHVLADHTSGKRHQALLTASKRFEISQNSSIYVTRIKPEHDEILLKNFFLRFGQIKNCFIDKEKVSTSHHLIFLASFLF
jgi:hypothetical protein